VREENSVMTPYDESAANARLEVALDHMEEALQRSEASSERRMAAFAASVVVQVIQVVRTCDDG
jgi:hypothetical protein